LAQAAAFTAGTHDGLAAVRQGHVVFILPDRRPEEAAAIVADGLKAAAGRPVTVGAAGPAAGPGAMVAGYDEARRCLEALLALGRQGERGTAADLGFVGLLLGTRTDAEGYVRSLLGPVLEYDDRKGSKLVRTLEEYFATGGNLTRTGEALHVHVNTVTQRLDRVTRLLGKGWQEPERQLEVQLALRLHKLVR
jgi:DNA-binding PucR family transcriptional regulator